MSTTLPCSEPACATDRYTRQIVLPEIGTEGQKRLASASVLCVGAGGLGSPALLYLAAAGVGRIGIVDDDTVDISNLQRQVMYTEHDVGKPKATAARDAVLALNSTCEVLTYPERLTSANAESLIQQHDVVIDGTDNFHSKYLINDTCTTLHKPWIYGSILGFTAHVSVFTSPPGPCYRCLYPHPPTQHVPNCAQAGVMGAVAGMAGSVQALEAIKLALGGEWCQRNGLTPLMGRLWLLDAKTMHSRVLELKVRDNCPGCNGERITRTAPQDGDLLSVEPDAPSVTAADALQQIGRALFIDVREPHEQETGKIPAALPIPLQTLLDRALPMGHVSPDHPIIVYCQHGVRSSSAVRHLTAVGFSNVRQLLGGMSRWRGPKA